MTLYALPSLQPLGQHLDLVRKNEMSFVRIKHPKVAGIVSLFGGQVLSFRPKNQPEMIWLSPQTVFDAKTALRGGIPICWPWFGRLATPAHGFARTQIWELDAYQEDEQGVELVLLLTDTPDTRAIWDHAFQLRLHLRFDQQLNVNLTITNTDLTAWAFSAALHTYLTVSDLSQVQVKGLGETYIDKLNNDQTTQAQSPLLIKEALDRIYTQSESQLQLLDSQAQHTLTIENQGHNAAVVWNPGASGAQAMADMPDEGYRSFLCVEAAITAPSLADGLVLQPNQSHNLTSLLFTQPLDVTQS